VKDSSRPLLDLLGGAWKWLLTYLAVVVAEVFFRAKDANEAWLLIRSMVGLGTGDSPGGATGPVESILEYFGVSIPYWNYSNSLITVGLSLFIVLIFPNVLQLFDQEGASLTKVKSAPALIRFDWKANAWWGGALAVLASITLLLVTGNSEFLYFRF
jgi:hypothetical protein